MYNFSYRPFTIFTSLMKWRCHSNRMGGTISYEYLWISNGMSLKSAKGVMTLVRKLHNACQCLFHSPTEGQQKMMAQSTAPLWPSELSKSSCAYNQCTFTFSVKLKLWGSKIITSEYNKSKRNTCQFRVSLPVRFYTLFEAKENVKLGCLTPRKPDVWQQRAWLFAAQCKFHCSDIYALVFHLYI